MAFQAKQANEPRKENIEKKHKAIITETQTITENTNTT